MSEPTSIAEAAASGTRVLIVEIAGERRSLPLAAVREVLGDPAVTPVPRAPHAVAGVTSVRGAVTTVVESAHLLAV